MKQCQAAVRERQQAHRLAGFRDLRKKLEQRASRGCLVGERSIHKIQDDNVNTVIGIAARLEVAEGFMLSRAALHSSRACPYLLKNRYRVRLAVLLQSKVFLFQTRNSSPRFIVDDCRNQNQLCGRGECGRRAWRSLRPDRRNKDRQSTEQSDTGNRETRPQTIHVPPSSEAPRTIYAIFGTVSRYHSNGESNPVYVESWGRAAADPLCSLPGCGTIFFVIVVRITVQLDHARSLPTRPCPFPSLPGRRSPSASCFRNLHGTSPGPGSSRSEPSASAASSQDRAPETPQARRTRAISAGRLSPKSRGSPGRGKRTGGADRARHDSRGSRQHAQEC